LNYQFFEHTADIGVIVEGKTIEELISNLVLVFSDLTTDIEKLDNSIEMVISVNGKDLEDAIIRLIEEVIFIFETKKFLPKECSILLEDKRITSRMKGDRFDLSKHNPKFIIKAITYHQFKLQKDNDKYILKAVFDV